MFIGITVLPFIGEVNLSGSLLLVFAVCLIAVAGFEFVNGFHDTANAVATVIYTKALKPVYAIPWSGCWNFLGVFLGGVTVAMSLLKLVPLNALMALPIPVGACLVLSVLFASILWNLGTWYLGIPCSSSHSLIGAMIGASLAFTWYYGGNGVNWSQAKEIGLSLLTSPLIGFGLAALLMLFLKHIIKSKALFHIPEGENDRPPILIRALLITTCTLVSFFHGSNDGQKGVGLFMLILIAFLPAKFAVNPHIGNDKTLLQLNKAEQVLSKNAFALNEIAKAFKSDKMQILYVAEKPGSVHLETNEGRLRTLIKPAELAFNYISNNNPLNGIMNFIETHHTDMLCLVKHHHNLIYRLFTKSTVNQIMNKSVKAILVLHE